MTRQTLRSLLAPSCLLLIIACGPADVGDQTDGADPGSQSAVEAVNPSMYSTFSGSMPKCHTALASWNGTTAYSNGPNTGTGYSCGGGGTHGLRYQCVELVMRHFKINWGLRWYGNAKYILSGAPKASVDVYYNGDGANPPVPGDMLVWTKGTYGHVALITKVTGSSVHIIEQNVKGSGSAVLSYNGKSIGARWGSWVPQGWAHAKANTAGGGPKPPGPPSPPPPPPPPANPLKSKCIKYGWISTCDVGGKLLECDLSTQQAKLVPCAGGCKVMSLGTPDKCNGASPPSPPPPPPPPPPPGGTSWNCAKSAWAGQQLWTCNGSARYRCFSGKAVKEACSGGCVRNKLGQNDVCGSPASGWSCNKSSWKGQQLWTCKGGTLNRCNGSKPVSVFCPKGCNYNPTGTNDTCK